MKSTVGRVLDRLAPHRHLSLLAFDTGAWLFAVCFAALARSDFQPDSVRWGPTLATAACTAVAFVLLAWLTRLHEGRAPLGSLDETIRLAFTALCVGIVVYLANLFRIPWLPRSVPLIATLCAILIMAWGRALARAVRENAAAADVAQHGQPVLVIGAGEAGRQLIRSMLRDSRSRWAPVGLIDDDRLKRHLRIDGVAVLGPVDDLAAVAQRLQVSTVVIAIPSAGADALRRISAVATDAHLTVKVLPGVNDLLHGRVGIRDVRDIDLPDLLGRREIHTDIGSIAGYLTGKRVLVTGAGGSIGSELCRQIVRWRPAGLIMLDRDESALHAVQLSIEGRALLDTRDIVLADIRDPAHIFAMVAERRPHVVFHAAALKHLPMLERYPAEAVKTNIWGTQTVLEAAQAAGVDTFVNISTDKAADPVSVLGYSKRIGEGLTAAMSARADGRFLSVRFGNVLGSRGSVLTAFAAQIAAGGPVTVTHPDVTRYFMTVAEAVELVIQAGISGRSGEALVLDMGKPVKIDAVAGHLIDLTNESIEIEYTGLRSGEKLHEDLLGADEPDVRPAHPLLSHVTVPMVDVDVVHSLDLASDRDAVIRRLAEICARMNFSVEPAMDSA